MKKSKHLFKLWLIAAVLIVSTGVAHGDEYYKVRVQCVYEGTAANCNVFVSATNATPTSSQWESGLNGYVTDPLVKGTGWDYNTDVFCYAQASEGSYFDGWYSDLACTNLLSEKQLAYNFYKDNWVAYSADPESAPEGVLYAKFTSNQKFTYYAQARYIEDPQHRGALRYKSSKYYYAKDSESDEKATYAASVTFNHNVTAYPKRGYQFVDWSLTGENADYNSSYNKDKVTTYFHITATSTDPGNPDVATMQANYEKLPELTLTIQKQRNRGSVTVSYQNKTEYTSTYLKNQTYNLEAFAVDAELEEKVYSDMYNTDRITMTATPAEGYEFFGWYFIDGDDKYVVSNDASVTFYLDDNETYFAYFNKVLTEDDKFIVGQNACHTLEDAISVALSSPSDKTIRQLQDYTIPAGTYTIPKGVTLLIPYEEDQEQPDSILQRTSNEDIPTGAYRTLTLAEGAHLNVYGAIEVGGRQSTASAAAGGDKGVGCPAAPTYGQMILNTGSSITLNDGSQLRAWGYVTGTGEIDVRRGAVVREQFQVMDWRGYELTTRMFNSHKVLQISQYYIQNVEAPAVYHPGSRLTASTAIRVLLVGAVVMNDAGIIGVKYNDPGMEDDKAIFLMDNEDDSEDTWVRKYYNPTTDQQVYEVNNAAYLGSLVMKMSAMGMNFTMNSAEYDLPITNNFKIHLLSGELLVTQNTILLPGSEIELDKKSTLTINPGQTLYMYDTEQWGKYVCGKYISEDNYEFTYGTRVKYRPGGVPNVRDISTRDGQGDAKLTVHGTVNVEGRLFTTESGAAITSTIADAGTVTFTNAAPTFSTSHFVEQTDNTTPHYVKTQCVSALLSNGVGSTYSGGDGFTETAGTPAGKSFCFIDIDGDEKGEWVSLTSDGCWAHDQNGVCYIKPHAYVPISIGEPEEKPDHTYRDEYAGTDGIYILAFDISGNCQWWEVEAVEGHPELFECKHKDNHTFYYYDNTYGWMEKRYKVEWENWDGSPVKYKSIEGDLINYYYVTYGTVPQWMSANPTREENANYSYTFAGWSPALAPVTEDVKYVAQYTETPRKFLITFKNAAGVELETTSYEYLAMPVAPTENVDLDTYQWSPAISAVTGNQIYQLVAKTGTYTVIYKNWNGEVLQTTADIESGTTTPSCPTPSKAPDALYNYNFDGWSPALAETVTADAIYTATYTRAPQAYTIRFFQEDGSTPIGDPQNLAYGAMPEVPEYSKEATAAKTYTLVWSPLVSAATKDQDYVATFTEKPRQYTVTWKNGEDVIETNYVNYGTTPVYSGVTPTDGDASTSFNGWTPTPAPVTGNQVYTAQFTTDILTISNGKTAAENETVGGPSVTTVIISKSGTIDLSAAGSNLKAENLILESDGSTASGQLLAENSQITADHIYFDYKVNAKNHKWYGVAVPWQVDATSGISVNGKTLVLGKDFDIIYYNGALRAEVGKQKCWSYVEEDVNKTLQPGRLYMIGLMMDAQTIRFEKKSGANILTTTTSVTAHSGAAASTDQGWNGVANPALFHAYINPGVTAGQVYNPETNSYDPILMNDAKFVVGQGAFVQVPATLPSIEAVTSNPFSAPRRARANIYKADVRIAPAEAEYTDRLFVRVEDEKEADTYVIGKDLEKLGVSKSVAQMWINRYNTELCLNTMTMVNGAAEYPLGIFAPHAGEYTIAIHNSQFTIHNEDYALYLTLNGEAIWNLSDAAYTGTFDAGTTSAYGLRISARAPQITTGIDEAVVDAKGETRKVLIGGQVFIIRGDKVYSTDGKIVR